LPYAPGWTIDEALETRNNRLLEYREYASLNPDPGALLRTVRYEYIEQTGHAAHLTTKDNYIDPYTTPGDPADYDIYRDLWLVYAKSGTLWKAVWQEWDAAGVPQNQWHRGWPYPTTPDRYTACWEFRYDTSGRERYYVRDWDVRLGTPDNLNPVLWTAGVTLWTDYLDEQPYVDYTVAEDHPNEMIEPERGFPSLVPTERERYLAGLGVHGQQTITPAGPTTWLHGDLIRSTMLTTDEGGTAVSAVAYSAFGEEVSTAGAEPGRYRVAGGWGYESGLLTLGGANPDLAPITLQHVGWRWYQPGVGRFVQRDPIGLEGALNVYVYCDADPLGCVDPLGLYTPATTGSWWARWFLNLTGGQGHVPVIDHGRAHDTVLIVAEIVSVCAPVGAAGRTITLTPKALAIAKKGWAGKYLVRIRQYIRYDRLPHHNKPPGWDGRWFGGR
jgi:RHS repeat-associated protein